VSIQLTIRLFGTLSLRTSDYNHTKGLLIEAPEGATPKELLRRMNISPSRIGLISCENKAIQYDTPLNDKAVVSFFSLMSGG
jgi:hypothetical protein